MFGWSITLRASQPLAWPVNTSLKPAHYTLSYFPSYLNICFNPFAPEIKRPVLLDQWAAFTYLRQAFSLLCVLWLVSRAIWSMCLLPLALKWLLQDDWRWGHNIRVSDMCTRVSVIATYWPIAIFPELSNMSSPFWSWKLVISWSVCNEFWCIPYK